MLRLTSQGFARKRLVVQSSKPEMLDVLTLSQSLIVGGSVVETAKDLLANVLYL